MILLGKTREQVKSKTTEALKPQYRPSQRRQKHLSLNIAQVKSKTTEALKPQHRPRINKQKTKRQTKEEKHTNKRNTNRENNEQE